VLLLLVPLQALSGLPIYYTQVSASDVSSTVTITLADTSNQAFSVVLANDGTKAVYVNANGATATTANMKMLPGEIHTLHTAAGQNITVLGIICGAGDTSTVRVFGFPTR
jgi:hypothetical protein